MAPIKSQEKQALINAEMSGLRPEADNRLQIHPSGFSMSASATLPRNFAVVIAPTSVLSDDGTNLSIRHYTARFPGFQRSSSGFWINSTWIALSKITATSEDSQYSFTGIRLLEEDGGGEIDGFINFASAIPTGVITHNSQAMYAIKLLPDALRYSISVSASAGAAYSSGAHDFTWDASSAEWQNATWELDAGILAFDDISNGDPIEPMDVIQSGVTDSKSQSPAIPPSYDFGLHARDYGIGYTAILEENTDMTNYLRVSVADTSLIPKPSKNRASSPVKALFFQQILVLFDELGETFIGAYMDSSGNVYAIRGLNIPSSNPSQSGLIQLPICREVVSQPLLTDPSIDSFKTDNSLFSPQMHGLPGRLYDIEADRSVSLVPQRLFIAALMAPVPVHLAQAHVMAIEPFSIVELFEYMQLPTSLHGHPVTLTVISFLLLTMTEPNLKGGFTLAHQFDEGGVGTFAQRLPALIAPSSWDLKKYYNALLMKCFYDGHYNYSLQPFIDLPPVDAALLELTAVFYANGAAFFTQYIQLHYNIYPSQTLAQQYAALLLESPWRSIRQIEQSQGTWANASLEMYLHFVKYQACGATDADIRNIYQQLTSTEPALEAGGFADITPTTWKTYQGWVYSGTFDGTMVSTQDLGKSQMGQLYAPFNNLTYVLRRVIDQSGFKKPLESSSCFSGNTLVIMEDGQLMRIDTIRPGNFVKSRSANGAIHRRKVAFISSPSRGSRFLYSINDSEWLTTATHPFISEADVHCVAFINDDAALNHNPTWLAFHTESLDSRGVTIARCPDERADEVETLYDLIFDAEGRDDIGPYCYFVTDGKTSMLTASEAPSVHVFPTVTAFLSGLILEAAPSLEFISVEIGKGSFDIFSDVGEISSQMFSSSRELDTDDSLMEFPSGISHILSTQNSRQNLASAAESIIACIGLRLVSELDSAWRFADADLERTTPMLVVQTLRFHNSAFCYGNLKSTSFKISINGMSYTIPHGHVTYSGPSLITFDHCLIDLSDMKNNGIVPIEIIETVNNMKLSGQCCVQDTGCYELLQLRDEKDEKDEKVTASMMVRISPVGKNGLVASESWDITQKLPFAHCLGCRVGQRIVERYQ